MTILALDLSLRATGWARSPVCTGVLTTKARGAERLSVLTKEVGTLAAGVGLVILEGYSYGSQGRAVFDIGELGGCVRLLLYRLGIPVAVVAPATLKRWATGRGNAPKDEMIAAAIRRFGFSGSDNNEADALLLWTMAAAHTGTMEFTLPQSHWEALEKVEWPRVGRDAA